MKSTYTDNFRHSLVFVPPVYNRTVNGKKVREQAPVIVLAHKDNLRDAKAAQAAYERQYAKRPGRIMIRPASEQVPHVGRNNAGKVMPRNAEAA